MQNSLKLPFTDNDILHAINSYSWTPFFLYSEKIIRQRARTLNKAFEALGVPFYNHFAVKANPNPYIVDILAQEWIWTDCSSMFELDLSQRINLFWSQIMFTSNNTTEEEFMEARRMKAIINLDDITHIETLEQIWLPELISCRFNPWELKKWNSRIWSPKEIKYWMSDTQIIEAYKILKSKWVKRFWLHTMVVTDERDIQEHLNTAEILFKLALKIRQETWITLEFINLWGWLGVPYTPEQEDIDLNEYVRWLKEKYEEILLKNWYKLQKILMENWRFLVWPAWAYITRVINVAEKYKTFVWVDWGMQDFPRPGRLKTYHHISVIWKQSETRKKIQSITWSLCIWWDIFASDRELEVMEKWDIIAIHTAWAHGHATWYNYNWRPRCWEILHTINDEMEIIRYPQDLDDLYWWVPQFEKNN